MQFLDSGHVFWGTHPGTGFHLFFFGFFVRENCNFWIPDMFSGGRIQGLGSICFFCFVYFYFYFLFIFVYFLFFIIFFHLGLFWICFFDLFFFCVLIFSLISALWEEFPLLILRLSKL